MRRVRGELLPISKGLVAEEPIPLAIPGIGDCVIGVIGVRGVVSVKAIDVVFARVSEVFAIYHTTRQLLKVL